MYFYPILFLWRLEMQSKLDNLIKDLKMEVMNEFNNENKYQILKRSLEIQLIKYLNKYLKKNFNMELVFHTIKKTLKKKEEITEKQFESIIKFIERELPFRGETRNRIYNYFSPVITTKRDRSSGNSLEQFMD